MVILSNMIESTIEIFMDDFSIFDSIYDVCLENLSKVLGRCVETNLVLKWEKCHFMVNKGIVLDHRVSSQGLDEDRAKIAKIEKLPPLISVKGVQCFIWGMQPSTGDSLKTIQRSRSPFVASLRKT